MIRSSAGFFAVFLLWLTVVVLNGQTFSLREFDEQQMRNYAEQRDFEYMNYTARPPSVWERVSWWFQSMIQRFFLNPNTPWFIRVVYYLLLLLIVLAAIFYIVRLRYGGGISTDYRRHQPILGGVQKTKEEDFDAMINESIQEGNFKLAIRYVYLKTLYSLAKRELIKLKEWKSPYDYEKELKADMVEVYHEMARLFEYVWYGDFEVGEEDVEKGLKLATKLEGV